jgi:hypothetical protein
MDDISRITDNIGREIGVNILTYTYEIQPQIILEASAEGKPIR